MSRSKIIAGIVATVGGFLIAWFFLAHYSPAWAEELLHMATGKSLWVSGKSQLWDFELGVQTQDHYSRGSIVSKAVAYFYAMGLGEVFWFRVIPLFFTMASFLLAFLYFHRRHKASLQDLLLLSLVFLGHTIILEKSLFVRVYTPLGLFVLASLILYWEGLMEAINKKTVKAALYWFAALSIFIVPTLDRWQVEHLPILGLALFLSYKKFFDFIIWFLREKARMVIALILGILLIFPFCVLVLDVLMSFVHISGRMGITFSTYWDNIAGTIRFCLTMNVLLLGLTPWFLKRFQIKYSFGAWLFLTGAISGIAIGLLNPHNFIFLSRYFYPSVVLTVVGAAIVFSKVDLPLKRRLIAIYLIINIVLSFITFYWDRSTIKDAIAWLNTHVQKEDIVLICDVTLELNNGSQLIPQVINIRSFMGEDGAIKLKKRLLEHPQGQIYYVYVNPHAFREWLYLKTTGERRTKPNQLLNYLYLAVPHKPVLNDLRGGAGLITYERTDLYKSLDEIHQNGYPPEGPNISIHKRILKSIFKAVHLPDKREDIMKLIKLNK